MPKKVSNRGGKSIPPQMSGNESLRPLYWLRAGKSVDRNNFRCTFWTIPGIIEKEKSPVFHLYIVICHMI